MNPLSASRGFSPARDGCIFPATAMYLALVPLIPGRLLSPAGGEPPAMARGATGAARAADLPAKSATCARTPASMPQAEAATQRRCFASGRHQLEAAIKKRRWPDGRPVGRGHAAPYLQPKFAAAIAERRKTFEGRPGGGWVQPAGGRALAPDDYVRFKVVGHSDVVRACMHVCPCIFESPMLILCVSLAIRHFDPRARGRGEARARASDSCVQQALASVHSSHSKNGPVNEFGHGQTDFLDDRASWSRSAY